MNKLFFYLSFSAVLLLIAMGSSYAVCTDTNNHRASRADSAFASIQSPMAPTMIKSDSKDASTIAKAVIACLEANENEENPLPNTSWRVPTLQELLILISEAEYKSDEWYWTRTPLNKETEPADIDAHPRFIREEAGHTYPGATLTFPGYYKSAWIRLYSPSFSKTYNYPWPESLRLFRRLRPFAGKWEEVFSDNSDTGKLPYNASDGHVLCVR